MAGNPALYWSYIQASCPQASDFIWRIVLGFGFFPAACTLYLRATMPETPRYTLHVMRDKSKVAADMSSVTKTEIDATHTVASTKADMSFGQFIKKYGKHLLGCAMCWFLLDVAFYSQNLFQKDVFLQIGWLPPAESVNAMTETFRVARAQALIALGSTIPGCACSDSLLCFGSCLRCRAHAGTISPSSPWTSWAAASFNSWGSFA